MRGTERRGRRRKATGIRRPGTREAARGESLGDVQVPQHEGTAHRASRRCVPRAVRL